MKFKRNEAFRYEFGVPLPATFHISKINNKPIESSSGDAKIHDISPGGMKIEASLNLPANQQVELTMQVNIEEVQLTLVGEIVWQKKQSNKFYYGIELITEDYEDAIIDALKKYQKAHK